MTDSLLMGCIQVGAMLVIATYVSCSLGVAISGHLRGRPFSLAERGTPLLRSFGDWAPRTLRLLMGLRRAALVAVIVLLGTGIYCL